MPSFLGLPRLAMLYSILALLLVAVIARVIRIDHVPDTPIERVLTECRRCGLGDDEISQMIANAKQRGLTREEELRRFADTFKPEDTHKDACMPCVEAVLDAAGVE